MKRAMWIVVSTLENGAWTTPEIASFSGRFNDIDPAISPDGRRLFFASNRPTDGGTAPKKDFDLWVVEKTASGWSEPKKRFGFGCRGLDENSLYVRTSFFA